MSTTDHAVSQRISRRRAELKIDAANFAWSIGVAAGKLLDYEAGLSRPSPITLSFVAERLGVTIAWLFAEQPTTILTTLPAIVAHPCGSSVAAYSNFVRDDAEAVKTQQDKDLSGSAK